MTYMAYVSDEVLGITLGQTPKTLRHKKTPPSLLRVGFLLVRKGVLAATYFHTAYRRTIIGIETFHGRVRDGNEWGHFYHRHQTFGNLCRIRNTSGGYFVLVPEPDW